MRSLVSLLTLAVLLFMAGCGSNDLEGKWVYQKTTYKYGQGGCLNSLEVLDDSTMIVTTRKGKSYKAEYQILDDNRLFWRIMTGLGGGQGTLSYQIDGDTLIMQEFERSPDEDRCYYQKQ
ncbi:hypothetical protein [Thermoflavimicrobium dichotomicum]|uniref:DUF5640 domain-containing protein n=1 Tax=Thermoflavimicrobium dichotomicum TaxID=46223 RepID=A0A1I3LH27_9BACL|nr:hypothetical protein [Thermoflavimicrobium dichotomicum]SFI84041.1 hypothetical protein SAMN05421852_102191 [Thermoflavimicrobium dichotomicum]